MSLEGQKRELALDLFEIGAVKFGEFTYTSGSTGPMYVDLRLFISYPQVLKKVTKIYTQMLEDISYDRLAGVAYAGLPIAGAISLELEKPWIFMRKEGLKKGHGLKKSLEGVYQSGETVAMIEDICNSATSLLQAIPAIEAEGLVVKDAVVLLNYQRGGEDNLRGAGYNLRYFMSVRELLDIIHEEGKIDDAKYNQCVEFLAG
jgi:uridine monophosphate synthetase